MRKEKRWVYYCDFCGKSGRSGGHMSMHEKHCTRNPDRDCRICRTDGHEGLQRPIADLIAALGYGDEAGVDRLREAASGCPACMLAAVKQTKLQHKPEPDGENGTAGFCIPFNHKREKEQFWADINAFNLLEALR